MKCFLKMKCFPQLESNLQDFYFVKDTSINGSKYIIIEDTTRIQLTNFIAKKIKIYLNKDLDLFHLFTPLIQP